MKDISIIIVSYKGWNRLSKCLEALDTFSGKDYCIEVIVVDNRSDDNILFDLEKQFPEFIFISNEVNGGFANGCNLGAVSATGTYLLFLNPDTVATESELEKLLEKAKHYPDYSVLSCRQVNEKGKESVASGAFPEFSNLTGFQRAVFRKRKPATVNPVTPFSQDVTFPDWVSGSVILIKKEKFIEIGGFDEDFWMYFEDVDLCRRVRNIQGEIVFCRDVTIEHNHGGSSRINLKTASLTKTEVHISRHVYISKHKSGLERLLIQIFLVINNLITCGLMALPGLILFFIPKAFTHALIFFRLSGYYIISVLRLSWISPRSVNFNKKSI